MFRSKLFRLQYPIFKILLVGDSSHILNKMSIGCSYLRAWEQKILVRLGFEPGMQQLNYNSKTKYQR